MGAKIISYGVYVPKYRITREEIARAWGGRGTGEVSFCWLNEDIYTMAAEASLNALRASGIHPAQIDAFYLATTSSPYVEHSVAKAITEVVGLKEDVQISNFNSSPQAGAAALKACVDAVVSGRIKYGLVVATDCRPASPGSDEERSYGAGAAAFLLAPEQDKGLVSVGGFSSASAYLVDYWRGIGDGYVKSYDPRFTREFGYTTQILKAAGDFLAKEGTRVEDYRYVVLPSHPDQRVIRSTGKQLNFQPEQMEAALSVYNEVGDTGATAVFLGIVAALEKGQLKDKILGIFYGSGIAEAVGLTIERAMQAGGDSLNKYLTSKEPIAYLDFLKAKNVLAKNETPAKLWVSPLSPLWYRDGASIRRLVGARCEKCGYVNFPAAGRKICIRCGAGEFEYVQRNRQGKIHTYCVNIYGPPGLESPLPVIVADMEDGTRYKALGTEFKIDDLKIDLPVELTWRKASVEDGVNAYIYFFRPLR